MRECDAEIARHFQAITPVWDDDLLPLDRQDKVLSHRKNAPAYDARSQLYQLTRVDLVTVPGLHASTVQTILAEIGLDTGKWPHATRSPVAKSCVRARCRPATAPDKPCA